MERTDHDLLHIYDAIRPGHIAELKVGIEKVFGFAQEHEPRYAAFASIDADEKEVTFFNAFSDSDAMRNHFALIPEIPGFDRIVASMDITRREIFGTLPPDLEAKTAGADLIRHQTTLSMSNRITAPGCR